MTTCDLLIFAEDPGAANYLLGLIQQFGASGFKTELFASGHALQYFKREGVPVRNIAVESAAQLVSRVNPALVMVGTAENPDTLAHELVSAARAQGRPSMAVVDAAMSAGLRFRGRTNDPLAFAPDYVLVTDEYTKQEFRKIGLRDDSIFVCGHPHFDRILARRDQGQEKWVALRRSLFCRAGPRQKILLFVSEGTRPASPEVEPRSPTEIILDSFFSSLPQGSDPYLVLRLHPKDDINYFLRHRDRFHQISQGGDPIEAIEAADVIVGITSMLLTEAALLKKPTLSMTVDRATSDWLPAVRNGASYAASDELGFRRHLAGILTRPEEYVTQKDFAVRGSTEKVLSVIHRILATSIKS